MTISTMFNSLFVPIYTKYSWLNARKMEEKYKEISSFFGMYGANRGEFTFSKTEIGVIKLLREHGMAITEDLGEEIGHDHFGFKYNSKRGARTN